MPNTLFIAPRPTFTSTRDPGDASLEKTAPFASPFLGTCLQLTETTKFRVLQKYVDTFGHDASNGPSPERPRTPLPRLANPCPESTAQVDQRAFPPVNLQPITPTLQG